MDDDPAPDDPPPDDPASEDPAPEDRRREALQLGVAGIEAALGPVVGLREVVAGTAPAWRVRLDVAGVGTVFAKVADGGPWAETAVAEEALLLEALHRSRRQRHVPPLLAADPDGAVPWLVLPDLAGASWPPPWPDDLAPVWQAVDRLAATAPPAWLEVVVDHDPWADGGGPAVDRSLAARLRDRAAGADLSGTDLVHGDLGAGNLAVVDGRVLVVDWSDAHIGSADLDRTTLAIDVAHASGRRVPPPVADPAAWIAKVAGLLLDAARRPAWPGPGGARVRAQQADLARTAVAWARDLT